MKNRHDYYYKKAKQENYAARSVYKLEEAINRYKFIKSTDYIFDVGCSPGSWSKYLLEKVLKTNMKLVGIDLNRPALKHKRFDFIKGDIEHTETGEILGGDAKLFDVVISDAMPNTTMDKETNHYQSINLANVIYSRLADILKPGGHFYIKVYDGSDLSEFRKTIRSGFEKHTFFKPKSSRDESRELFILATGRL